MKPTEVGCFIYETYRLRHPEYRMAPWATLQDKSRETWGQIGMELAILTARGDIPIVASTEIEALRAENKRILREAVILRQELASAAGECRWSRRLVDELEAELKKDDLTALRRKLIDAQREVRALGDQVNALEAEARNAGLRKKLAEPQHLTSKDILALGQDYAEPLRVLWEGREQREYFEIKMSMLPEWEDIASGIPGRAVMGERNRRKSA